MTILLLIGVTLAACGALLWRRRSRLVGGGVLALGLVLAIGALAVGMRDGGRGAATAPAPSKQQPSASVPPVEDPSRIVVCPGDPRCPKQ